MSLWKSINSQANNNKSQGNDSLTVAFYQNVSNELSLILLYVYDSWENPGNLVAISTAGIIFVMFKFRL